MKKTFNTSVCETILFCPFVLEYALTPTPAKGDKFTKNMSAVIPV